jgi:hypothetical protein
MWKFMGEKTATNNWEKQVKKFQGVKNGDIYLASRTVADNLRTWPPSRGWTRVLSFCFCTSEKSKKDEQEKG